MKKLLIFAALSAFAADEKPKPAGKLTDNLPAPTTVPIPTITDAQRSEYWRVTNAVNAAELALERARAAVPPMIQSLMATCSATPGYQLTGDAKQSPECTPIPKPAEPAKK